MNSDKFHSHLDKCPQCENNPFNLCLEGQRLLFDCAKETDNKPVVKTINIKSNE